MSDKIRVYPRGCVKNYAELIMPAGSSVQDALKMAGGVGRGQWKASGVVTIRSRRKRDNLGYRRRVLRIGTDDLTRIALRDMDNIIVQYKIPGDGG